MAVALLVFTPVVPCARSSFVIGRSMRMDLVFLLAVSGLFLRLLTIVGRRTNFWLAAVIASNACFAFSQFRFISELVVASFDRDVLVFLSMCA